MSLYDMKAFFRFLEEASMEQLEDRRMKLATFLPTIVDQNLKREARWLLQKVEEEILTRTLK